MVHVRGMRNWVSGIGLAGAALAALAATAAADWPKYLGPNGSGVVTDAKVAKAWPDGGPPVFWETDVGPGFGGAAVVDGKVYLLDRVGEEGDKLRVLDLASGRELWASFYEAPGKVGHHGSRSTPTVDAGRVYTVGPFGHLYCFDTRTRRPAWHVDLAKDLGAKRGGWAFAQSPLVHGGRVIVSIKSASCGAAAFDKATGRLLWKSDRIGGADCYTSPAIATVAGVEQVLVLQKGALAGLDPADGRILWKYEGYAGKRPIPNPVVVGEDRIFITSGYGAGCAMVRLERAAAGFAVKELFNDKRSGSKTSPALYADGHIYSNTETGDGLQCMTADGEVKWRTGRSPSFHLGSLILADGVLFVMDGKGGVLHMVEASPEGYKEFGRADVLDGKTTWGPLALADGKLLVRDTSTMKCLDVAAK